MPDDKPKAAAMIISFKGFEVGKDGTSLRLQFDKQGAPDFLEILTTKEKMLELYDQLNTLYVDGRLS